MDECAAEKPGSIGCGCSSGKVDAASKPADPFTYFSQMIPNCLQYAQQAKAQGRPVIGILCEFTPRELIMAAGEKGGVPVCLCGGSQKTIAPAEQHLPSNLCPLIKSTYGYHLTKTNPFLEMADLVIAETTCDGKKKMFELMGETRSMYVLELPQKPDDPDALNHWHAELLKLRAHLERQFKTPITPSRLRQAMATMNRERGLRRQLAALMKREHPPLTGRQLLDLKSSVSGIPEDFAQYEKALSMLSAAPDICRKDRVRVLMTGVPMAQGAERVIELIEANGGLVVCLENCTGLKPILEDTDAAARDPLRAIAEKYFHLPCSVMTKNTRRLETLKHLAAEYRPECVIELIWQACLTYDVESYQVRRMVEQELKIPYLRIETDYSPSDSARLGTRIEALFETAKQRRT